MNKLSIKKMSGLTKKKKGFTLVELIIVIAIIAILAAIAIPKFGAVREDSNNAADIANAKNISLAVSKAIAEGNVDYDPAVENAALTNVGGANIEDEIDGITATTHVRTAGFTDNEYTVSVDTDGNVRVFAGEAGADGTEIYPTTNAAFQ